MIQSVFYFICSTCWCFFYWVGIVRSQCMYSSSALNCWLRFSGVTQNQELLNLLAWLDSLANITNQHHTYNEFLQFFLGISTFILFCLLTLFFALPHNQIKILWPWWTWRNLVYFSLFLYYRSLAGSDWSVRLIT